MKRVLLDMDGVLVNFVEGIRTALGKPWPYTNLEAMGEWGLDKLWGITPAEFWAPCDSADFWAELDWMPDGEEILRVVEEFAGEEVYLLTSPSLSPESYRGKAQWVASHMPKYRSRLLMGACKHLLAQPEHLLVDDADHNATAFKAAGGRSVLVPRPWNGNWTLTDKAVDYVGEWLYTAEVNQ